MSEQTEVQKLEERLISLCKQDDGFVVTINGEWGVGKTHFWNDFSEKHLQNQNVAYVSLFGKESIKDILTSIMVQVSIHAKLAEEANDVFRKNKLLGIDIASVFSIGKPRDFKDVVVCFDDFERSSEKIDDKDILGLISELKEQKNCQVIMIYNQDEVISEVFSSHKDKIIDYELYFKPTTIEAFSHTKHKLKAFKRYPLGYFKQNSIINIRIMKRVINALNDFEFLTEHLKDFPEIEVDVIFTIMQVATCNAMFNDFNLESLVKYSEEKRKKEEGKDFKFNRDNESMLSFFNDDSRYFLPSEITYNIGKYIKSSVPDKDGLISLIEPRKHQADRYKVKETCLHLHSRLNHDFSYSLSQYTQDMYTLMNKHKEYIVEVINPSSFVFYIEEMDRIDSKEDYHSFGVYCIKKYISDNLVDKSLSSLDHFGNLQKMLDFDASIQVHIDEVLVTKNEQKISNMEDIYELIRKPRNSGYSADEAELLLLVDNQAYEKYILNEPEFFEEVISFINWAQELGGRGNFGKVADKLVDVLIQIRDTGDKDKAYRITRALVYLNREQKSEENECE